MLRRAVLLPLVTVLAACAAAPSPAARGVPVAEVSLPAAPPSPAVFAPEEPEPQRPRCVIRGTGELVDEGRERRVFEVFAGRRAGAPSVIIRQPWKVHVTWSALPHAKRARRAQIALGGQKLLRLTGWTELAGRTFQIRSRADVHADHLWVRGGSPVEIAGVEGDRVRLRARTPFAQPAELEALTACDNVVYEPSALQRRDEDAPAKGVYAIPTGHELALHEAPGGPRLMTLTLQESRGGLSLGWLEVRDGFVRVSGGEKDIAFEGWVPAAQVEQPHGISFGVGFGRSRCGGIGLAARTTTVPADAEVWVGTTPEAAPIGVVEAGAVVVLGEERGDRVAFRFEGFEIGAPEGQQMWVRKAAVGR